MRQEEKFKCGEVGEARNGTGETVPLEAQDSELSQRS